MIAGGLFLLANDGDYNDRTQKIPRHKNQGFPSARDIRPDCQDLVLSMMEIKMTVQMKIPGIKIRSVPAGEVFDPIARV